MEECILLFKEIVNSKWFIEAAATVVLLNKVDIFKAKQNLNIDLSVCFPDYSGGLNYNNAIEFIKNKFLEVHQSKFPIHFCSSVATSTPNVEDNLAFLKSTVFDKHFLASIFGCQSSCQA